MVRVGVRVFLGIRVKVGVGARFFVGFRVKAGVRVSVFIGVAVVVGVSVFCMGVNVNDNETISKMDARHQMKLNKKRLSFMVVVSIFYFPTVL
jgi:hypothetical protein